MTTASAPATAPARSVVKKSRPDAILAATSAPSPGSKIGTSPRCSRAIFAASWSTQATVDPNSEKHAPETRPTYPVPTIAIRIRSTSFEKGKGSNPRWFSAVGSKPIYYRIRYVETSRALAVRLPSQGYIPGSLRFALSFTTYMLFVHSPALHDRTEGNA